VALKVLKRSNGFSLIEVIIALFILAIALLALAGLMISTTKNNSFGGHMTEAATFAQDKLEQLRAAPWASIVAGADTVTTAIPGAPGTGISYARSWTVAYNPNGDQAWVTITINWTDPTAKTTHSINLRSVVGQ
jgi:prepilin-type N-terminal cleavage/methylation domain-containing protein